MMVGEAVVVGLALFHTFLLAICAEIGNQTCRPSSCGETQNISYPFRLQNDAPGCGDPDYELVCQNNRTVVYLPIGENHSHTWRFYVADINYNRSTIRAVYPEVENGNCFSTSLPSSILFSASPYEINWWDEVTNTTILMKCERPISDGNYIPITPCNTTNLTSSSSRQPYVYALVGGESMAVGDINFSCTLGSTLIIPKVLKPAGNLSMSDLQEAMLLGLELSFLYSRCKSECEAKNLSCDVDYGKHTIRCSRGKSKSLLARWRKSLCTFYN